MPTVNHQIVVRLKIFRKMEVFFKVSNHFHLNMGIIGLKGSYAFPNADNA